MTTASESAARPDSWDSSRRIAERWQGFRPLTRGLLVFGAFALALNLVTVLGRFTGGSPSGPASSSYATSPRGLAAYFELLGRNGHPAHHLRSSPGKVALDPATTLFVMDPFEILPEESTAIRGFVEAGGQLVATEGQVPWLGTLMRRPPLLSDIGRMRAQMLTDIYPGVRNLRFTGTGSWERAGQSTPIVSGNGRVLVTTAKLGAGDVILLADASAVQNDRLGEADNAGFGLSVAGGPGRPVAFLESVHGYGGTRGLGALPTRWKITLLGLTLAMLTWLLARGRRLGPPEDAARDLPPPRQVYVMALATLVAKTKEPRPAIDVLSHRAMALLARSEQAAGRGVTDRNALIRAARRFGLDEAEVSALFDGGSNDQDLLIVAQALSAVSQARSTAPP